MQSLQHTDNTRMGLRTQGPASTLNLRLSKSSTCRLQLAATPDKPNGVHAGRRELR